MPVNQWELFGSESELRSGVAYGLRNRINDRSVKYGEREYGINLVWDRASDIRNITFDSGTPGAVIQFGQPVSIHVQGGGHLDYAERENGINLVWRAAPTRQWLIGGGATGTPIKIRTAIRLTNTEHGDYLVYGERDRGINLRWMADIGGYGSYPPLPMPELFRSPSGEPGQIELSGSVEKLKVFHGGTDDELDWNLYIQLDPSHRQGLFSHILAHGRGAKEAHAGSASGALMSPATPLIESDLNLIECELMVLDGYDNSTFDELFYSADVTEALRLEGLAWDHSADAGREQNIQGASKTVGTALMHKRVRVQGPFVNDADHRFKIEVHPLDSIAYPLNGSGAHIDAVPGSSEWPAKIVWRVAAFTNSSFHRINGAEYVKRDRHTRWFLELPSGLARFGWMISERLIGFTNEGRRHNGLDDRRPNTDQYESSGVLRHSSELGVDPRDGKQKLQVDVTMARPTNRWGGMFIAEYALEARSGPVDNGGVLHP